MLRAVRATAPAGLVPLAWGFALAAHLGALSTRTVLIGHGVMTALLVAFAALSWREMRGDPALRPWLGVVVAGVPVTLAGAYGVATGAETMAVVAVAGWLLLPAVALVDTGRRVPDGDRPWSYTVGGALSAVAALGVVVGTAAGGTLTVGALVLGGVGQTVGIVAAVVTY
ncbi:hypothetical protein [Halorarius halobius]|uniref:hypothetical protein n=1 Tax=Halorarius halobius TaxID=2962671 RepID=UPI0020CDF016|nr:hypothetical protein [Halorarius halobius]